MEAIQSDQVTLKQILQENWCSFLDVYHLLVQWYGAYNVWKVINCREPDGLGYATFACPVHPLKFLMSRVHAKAGFALFVQKFK